MLVASLHGRVLAEVDAETMTHDRLAVPGLTDADGGLVVEEGDDDAAERAEGRPGVDGARLLDELADGLEVVGAEDVEVLEVGEDERVGGGCGLGERGEGGEVEG